MDYAVIFKKYLRSHKVELKGNDVIIDGEYTVKCDKDSMTFNNKKYNIKDVDDTVYDVSCDVMEYINKNKKKEKVIKTTIMVNLSNGKTETVTVNKDLSTVEMGREAKKIKGAKSFAYIKTGKKTIVDKGSLYL